MSFVTAPRLRSLVSALALVALLSTPGMSAIATFYGIDAGAAPGASHPASNSAAADFDAAVIGMGASSIITFENLPVGSFASMDIAPGVTSTLAGVDTSTSGISTSADAISGYNTTASGANFLRVTPTYSIASASNVLTFSTPVLAFGAYFTGVGTHAGVLHVVYNDGAPRDLIVTGSGDGGVLFFGFISSSDPISSIALEMRGVTDKSRDIYGLDDVRLVTSVPEPATLSILALGGLALARRRNS